VSKLIIKMDAIWFKVLKKERGEFDEIDEHPANGLGTFHILCKGNHPRLRYFWENSLLVNWLPHHYNWHHYAHNDEQYKVVEKGIIKKRGKNYCNDLLILERSAPKLDANRLRDLIDFYTAYLKT